MNNDRKFMSAVHESSHTLAAYLMGAKITKVEIFPNGNGVIYNSFKWYTRNDIFWKDARAARGVTILLAGPSGEAKYSGFLNLAGIGEDLYWSRMCLRLKGFKEEAELDDLQFYEKFSGGAKRFVSHEIRWRGILSFASELFKQKSMSGQQAVEFLLREGQKLTASDQIELFFPADNLGGFQLPLEEHGK